MNALRLVHKLVTSMASDRKMPQEDIDRLNNIRKYHNLRNIQSAGCLCVKYDSSTDSDSQDSEPINKFIRKRMVPLSKTKILKNAKNKEEFERERERLRKYTRCIKSESNLFESSNFPQLEAIRKPPAPLPKVIKPLSLAAAQEFEKQNVISSAKRSTPNATMSSQRAPDNDKEYATKTASQNQRHVHQKPTSRLPTGAIQPKLHNATAVPNPNHAGVPKKPAFKANVDGPRAQQMASQFPHVEDQQRHVPSVAMTAVMQPELNVRSILHNATLKANEKNAVVPKQPAAPNANVMAMVPRCQRSQQSELLGAQRHVDKKSAARLNVGNLLKVPSEIVKRGAIKPKLSVGSILKNFELEHINGKPNKRA